MRTIRACDRCGRALPKRHRKYCENCSALASKLWKQTQRRQWRGTPYYLDPWLKKASGDEHEARRLRREYMRNYRAKRRSAGSRLDVTPTSSAPVGILQSGEAR